LWSINAKEEYIVACDVAWALKYLMRRAIYKTYPMADTLTSSPSRFRPLIFTFLRIKFFKMKGFPSALFIAVAASRAIAQSLGPESMPSEQFGILTIHR
jgi:hypothetical protein